MPLKPEHQIIRELSDKIVAAQAPIRILDAIKWDDNIRQEFFNNKCQKLPAIDKDYYNKHPLPFDVNDKIIEFRNIVRETKNRLGEYSNISALIESRCDEYCKAINMLSSRGTPLFSYLAMELYGSPDDAFYPKGPRLSEIGVLLGDTLKVLSQELQTDVDDLTAKQIAAIALASAYATKQSELIKAIFTYTEKFLQPTEIEGVKIAASLMAMTNVYYRFIHIVSDNEFKSLPAKLRMNKMANSGLEQVDFELSALAVSAINNCQLCIDSHVNALKKHGLSLLAIQTAIRVAAVITAAAQSLVIRAE